MDTQSVLIYTFVLVGLLLFSAYFSATETAFSSLNKNRLKTMADKGGRRAALALSMSEEYDKLISTVLIGNNIVNIAAASLATVLFVSLCGDIGATVSTAVVTVAVLIFGEITPKSIAKDAPERFAVFAAPFLKGLMVILTPVNLLFSLWKSLISKLFRVKKQNTVSQEELLLMVNEVQQDGNIDNSEGSLLRNAITFGARKAEDILTHRVDLEAVALDAPKAEIARVFSETKYSRLLVYEDSIDKIVGVIHQKDFYHGEGVSPLPLRELMVPPIFVPKSEKISDLLKILQDNQSQVAVVLDEYGGTLGIVTMEDILEELVGEIWDEHDEVVESFRKTGERTYRVDCAADLEEFCSFFGIDPDSEVNSLSGWITEKLGCIPSPGDRLEYGGLTITVESVDAHRVESVTVLREEPLPEEKTES